MIRTPVAVNTPSNTVVNLASRSRIKEFEAVSVILEVHQEITGLLGHPRARGMGGDSGQVHAPGAMLNEEQHVQAAQEHRVDVEEVRGEDRLRLGLQERPPGLPGPSGCRSMSASLRICHACAVPKLAPYSELAFPVPVRPLCNARSTTWRCCTAGGGP
jgi:hypothetical protein